MSQVVVIVGGAALSPTAVAAVEPTAWIIAADSGFDHARAAGLQPQSLVGDMDSISATGMAWARANAVDLDPHPRDKDLTDTAIALEHARRSGHPDLLVLGGAGDRLDHTLGTIVALGAAANACFATIAAHLNDTRLQVIFPGHELALDAVPGTSFSLIALHGDCHDITVTGARWPLAHAALTAGSTRGLSNETARHTTIRLGAVTLNNPSLDKPLTVIYS